MKIQTAILICVCTSAMAQSDGNFLGSGGLNPAQEQAAQESAEARAKQASQEAYRNFLPKDPWRKISGQTLYAKGNEWFTFHGTVLEVQPNGIRVDGGYGNPGSYYQGIFFVEGFPYQVAENESVQSMSQNFTALEDGVYTYATAIGGTSTIRKLAYGIPCDPPPLTPQQLAAIKSKQELDKRIAEQDGINAVRQLQTDATNGNASAQTSLALHYLDGRGCETNRELAVYWLTQAAKQGDEEASNTLVNLK